MGDWNQSDSDSENESGDVLSVNFTKTSFLLVILDTADSMFAVGKDNLSPFQMTVRSCLNIAERLLLTLKENSRIAIILNGKSDFTNFKTPVCSLVKLLLDLNAQSNEELKKKYMSSSPLNVADMLLSGKRIYKDVKAAGSRNLVFLTNDDCPTRKDDKAKDAAKYEAQNIGKNIIFDIITFSQDFEFEEFYEDILKAAKRPVVYECCPDLELLENKLGFYCIYLHHESSIKFYPLEDDFDTKITLTKSRFIRRNRDILSNVRLTLDHSEEVTREVERVTCNEYYLENDRTLILSAAERDELITHNIPTGLHLVSIAPPTEWMAPSSIADILYCRDGDQEKLEPFWDHCKETGNVLICVIMKQRNKLGRHCELHPINVDHSKCFLIHTLTYSHDRYRDEHLNRYEASKDDIKESTPVEIKSAEDLINAMTIDYNRDIFRCPAASKLREYFRSELLEVPLRPLADIDVRTRQYVVDEGAVRSAAESFRTLLIDPYEAPKAMGTKRAAKTTAPKEKASKAAPKKRSKKEDPSVMHIQ